MVRQARQIFSNQTTNGNSDSFGTNGKLYLRISGTFDSAAIQIQSKTNNTNDDFSTTGDSPITQAAQVAIPYSPGITYRLVLSSAGASTNINAFVTV